MAGPALAFPTPLTSYGPASPDGLLATLAVRASADPFNRVATTIFVLAVCHTFAAARVTALSHAVQKGADGRARASGIPPQPSVVAEALHFLGEVEVVFGVWAVVLAIAIAWWHGVGTATHYLDGTVNYTEPLFVVVVMALAATRPVMAFAETALGGIARIGGGTPAAWWVTILTVGPLLGSVITEPAAMTIAALLLARQIYDRGPSSRLRIATVGLLFVNVSIGGTLTHFAAPPVLMVARVWSWDTPFMLGHFGWRAVLAIVASNALYYAFFRRDLAALAGSPARSEAADEAPLEAAPALPIPAWITGVHLAGLAWTVVSAHHPALFIGGFLFFLGFMQATAPYQRPVELRSPLLVGFFLAGLVIHGGLQAWWIEPVLASLSAHALFFAAAGLTALNDNALITYLATLVPNLSDGLKIAVVEGAVAGGGLTLIANAPNPAGHAILSRYFGGAVPPLGLALAALIPTIVSAFIFRAW